MTTKSEAELREALEDIILDIRTDFDYNSDGDKVAETPDSEFVTKILALLQAAQQQLLTELLEHVVDEGEVLEFLPGQQGHFKRKAYVPVSIIENKRKEL
jgi:hypothetical protein